MSPKGHLLACERGRAGERYILGWENLTLPQILDKLGGRQRGRRAALAHPLRRGICGGGGEHRLGQPDRAGAARSAGCGPNGAKEGVRFADKAKRELGFRSRPGGRRAETRGGMVSGERLRLIVGIRRRRSPANLTGLLRHAVEVARLGWPAGLRAERACCTESRSCWWRMDLARSWLAGCGRSRGACRDRKGS